MKRRNFLKGSLAATALLSCNPLQSSAITGESPLVPITFFHTNDTHAHLVPLKRKKDGPFSGGMAHLAALIKTMRQKEPNSLLLSAGDVFQGTLFYNFFKGVADFQCMNYMGYDAMVLGNHEFDDYQDVLLKTLDIAKFPVLSANLAFSKYTDLNARIQPFIIKEVSGVKIGIIGLTTDELFQLTNPKYLSGVIVNDMASILSRYIDQLRRKVDLIVVLSHIGLNRDLELAATVEGIDIIIGGHSHAALAKPVTMKNPFGDEVIINQAGEWAEHLGMIKIEYNREDGSFKFLDGGLIPVNESCGTEATVLTTVNTYNKKLDKETLRVIGKTSETLVGTKMVCRKSESNLGNLIADAIRDHYKTDIGLCNGGGIRSSILGPEITIKDALEAFPFDNLSVKVSLKGDQLIEAFKLVASRLQGDPFGGFLQVSGCRIIYENGEYGGLFINDKPVENSRLYSVAMSDFMAAGGDGFTMFKDAPEFMDGSKINDLLIEYIEMKSPLNYKTEGRILIK